MIKVTINGEPVEMEIDTSAAVTILAQEACKLIKLQPTKKKLRSATGQLMELAGEAIVQAEIEGVTKDLRLFIAEGKCPPLFGRDRIQAFYGKDWAERLTQKVNTVNESGKPEKLQVLLDKYAATIFKPGLGKLKEHSKSVVKAQCTGKILQATLGAIRC